jgi:hypothetical protein
LIPAIIEDKLSNAIGIFRDINQTELPAFDYFIYNVNLFGISSDFQDVLPERNPTWFKIHNEAFIKK